MAVAALMYLVRPQRPRATSMGPARCLRPVRRLSIHGISPGMSYRTLLKLRGLKLLPSSGDFLYFATAEGRRVTVDFPGHADWISGDQLELNGTVILRDGESSLADAARWLGAPVKVRRASSRYPKLFGWVFRYRGQVTLGASATTMNSRIDDIELGGPMTSVADLLTPPEARACARRARDRNRRYSGARNALSVRRRGTGGARRASPGAPAGPRTRSAGNLREGDEGSPRMVAPPASPAEQNSREARPPTTANRRPKEHGANHHPPPHPASAL